MENIIVQEFNIKVEGKGFFVLQTVDGDAMVPTFGFDKDGKVLSVERVKKEGYAPLQQEWINEHIVNAAKCHLLGNPKTNFVYVAVIKRSDAPNEIGIASSGFPMAIENSSIVVESVKSYEFS